MSMTLPYIAKSLNSETMLMGIPLPKTLELDAA